MRKTKRKGIPGDIIAIPLAAAGFAYGKLFKDCGLGVYDLITMEMADVNDVLGQEFWFFCCIFDNAIKSGKWKVIGTEEFPDEESAWPPPMYHQDVISGEFEIRHKGIHRAATERQVKGLFPQIMYFPAGLLQRIESERDRG
jgi:hypothetical protein